jgi:hypothetical protein
VWLQAVSVIGDAHRAAGSSKAAVKAYDDSLTILATSGHDNGSIASHVRARLAEALLDTGNESRALTVVESMLDYAQNVHIAEHGSTMAALEKVVSALHAKKGAFKARHAAEIMLAVRAPSIGRDDCMQELFNPLHARQLSNPTSLDVQLAI